MMFMLLPVGEECPLIVLPAAVQFVKSSITYFSALRTVLLMVAHTPLALVSSVSMAILEASGTVDGVAAPVLGSPARLAARSSRELTVPVTGGGSGCGQPVVINVIVTTAIMPKNIFWFVFMLASFINYQLSISN
jgi:hypothetical protein